MAKLKELVAQAVQRIYSQPGPRQREEGYHASSAGKCIRQVVVGRYLPQPLHEFNDRTKGIFHMGHAIDAFFKDAFEAIVREGDVRMLAPFQTISFADRRFPGVYGEGDVILLDFATKTMHWIDCKSCGHDQFFYKDTRGASLMNMLQVGTYLGSRQVQQIMQALGWEKFRGWLVYIDKEDLGHVTCAADRSCVEDARAYWEMVKGCDRIYRETGDIPLSNPEEDWECGYCNLYPPLPDIKYKNKTALKNATAQLRANNKANCDSSGETLFKGLMIPHDKVTTDAEG